MAATQPDAVSHVHSAWLAAFYMLDVATQRRYIGARGMAAEVFLFDPHHPGKVRKALAHYA
jgi:hypothetical protein